MHFKARISELRTMQDLYFIAIIPPADVAQPLDNLRHELSRKFNSSHALNSPPHITLVPPFKMKREQLARLEEALKKSAKRHHPFSLKVNDFGHFGQHTLFAKVNLQDKLRLLQQDVHGAVKDELSLQIDRLEREYHPHLTLAFKDLKKSQFSPAWQYLQQKELKLHFEACNIVLLRHSGKRWLIDKEIPL